MRIATGSNFDRLLAGINSNLAKLVRANEQAATGRRILRPSDDPAGSVRLGSLEERLARTRRFAGTVGAAQPFVDSAAAALEGGSGALGKARALVVQGLNGAASQADRNALADELDALREELLDVANSQFGDRFLFNGTAAGTSPFTSKTVAGIARAFYQGNGEGQEVAIGSGASLAINISGGSIFAANQFSGTLFEGLTGAAKGQTADEGVGFEKLVTRHTSTDQGTLGTVGVALVDGGAQDTFLGDQQLVIDTAAGTVQLGSGPVVALPDPSDPAAANVRLENELGGELRLDFSGFNGTDFNGGVRGDGEIALDGTSFVPIDFLATDLRLANPATGNVLHVDATGIRAARSEVVTFSGTVNLFDTLAGAAADLRNTDGLSGSEVNARLSTRLGELDRNQENLLSSLAVLGARSSRLSDTGQRLAGLDLELSALAADVGEADLTQVILDTTRAEQALTLVEATGVRLTQTTLLNFLS